jgi:hypothetical protein
MTVFSERILENLLIVFYFLFLGIGFRLFLYRKGVLLFELKLILEKALLKGLGNVPVHVVIFELVKVGMSVLFIGQID